MEYIDREELLMIVTPRFDPRPLGFKLRPRGPDWSVQLPPLSPAPVSQAREVASSSAPRRMKIWGLSKHLHCSIIGTCLSTGELRQLLNKTNIASVGASDHDLHGQAVHLAERHDGAAKLLHKTLDKRHRLAIKQFAKAKTAEEVRALWREAVKRGDIPGTYWAVLTHPATSEALARDVFSEVHMLSHLVGAANRADIRRLSELEAENAELQKKLRRQQEQLRDGITTRDATIRDLNALLARRIADTSGDENPDDGASEQATLSKLVGDLERRLTSEANRRAAVEKRLERLIEELRLERERRGTAEYRESILREELEAVEASLAPYADRDDEAAELPVHLNGLSLLYVGGAPNQLRHLRSFGEQLGARFLHHDGGIDDRSGRLAALVSRADVVMFPVDCVSHDAALMVKRLCRQAGKPYVPLRSTGMSSFVVALRRADIVGLRDRAGASAPF
ncbi:MAG: DUF2325 domain-containing protein [Alphaproteobacteria bacterium]